MPSEGEEVPGSDYMINEEVSSSEELDDEVLKGKSDDEVLREGFDNEVLREESDNEEAMIEKEFDDGDELLYEEEFGDDEELLYEEEFNDGDELLNEEEFGNDDGDESDGIVDKPLNSEQMPHDIDGEFAPYFKNVTEALMFCWIQKHKICKYQFSNDLFCHF